MSVQQYWNGMATWDQTNITWDGEVVVGTGDDMPQYIKAAWARITRNVINWRGGR